MALGMIDGGYRLIELALLTTGYWLVDALLRGDGAVKLLERMGLRAREARIAFFALPFLALASVWRWEAVPQGDELRVFAVGITAFLAWKAATRDVDPVTGDRRRFARWLLVLATLAAPLSPAFLFITTFLLTTPFGTWEHHATMPMRILQAVLAYLVLSAALASLPALFDDAAVLVFFVLVVQISHYLITALAKGFLGPRPWSWVTDNRLHHLAASAYSWGWARFLPWSTWHRVIAILRVLERPMQAAAFGIELLAPLALLHPWAGAAFCVGWAGFHVGVFLVSGLLFWEWILTDLLAALLILSLPASVQASVFGVMPTLVALVFLVLFPLRHKLWKPMPLGWWDTPFTQRMRWYAHGASGKVYEVGNDFMCPHERLYGKVHACFLAPSPVCTYHLGEVWKHDLRDALRDAGPSLERLETVRERFGIEPRSESMAEAHRAYLERFFDALNRGFDKHVLPRPLRWLKAPGGQCFYWGEGEPYRGQERVEKIAIRYREEYFDGEALVRLRDELVCEVVIRVTRPDPTPAPCEPTPHELDHFLLGFARGRLIDLPAAAGGYVQTDDGKRAS